MSRLFVAIVVLLVFSSPVVAQESSTQFLERGITVEQIQQADTAFFQDVSFESVRLVQNEGGRSTITRTQRAGRIAAMVGFAVVAGIMTSDGEDMVKSAAISGTVMSTVAIPLGMLAW